MTPDQYRTLQLRDMQRRRWRTAATVFAPWGQIEAGREVRIVQKIGGLWIETLPCRCCGVAFKAARVRPELIEELT